MLRFLSQQVLTSMWEDGIKKHGISKADFWALVSVVAAEIAIDKGIDSPHSKYIRNLNYNHFI